VHWSRPITPISGLLGGSSLFTKQDSIPAEMHPFFRMEIPLLPPYSFEMLLRAVKRRWLVLPFAAFILLFNAGAAVAPDCHVVSATQAQTQAAPIHSHSGVPHDHSAQSDRSSLSSSLEKSTSVGGGINEEICFVAGFIVLLLLRFSRFLRSIFTASRSSWPRLVQPLFITEHLGYLKLTHLKLGIIRI
jgi:hypothetical protein